MAYIGHVKTDNVLNQNTTSEIVKLEQNYLVLNEDEVGQGIDERQGGVIIERGQLPDAVIRYNEEIKSWEFGVESDLRILGKSAVKLNSSSVTKEGFIYLVDTTNQELSLLLPQNPKTGYEVEFVDLKGTFDVNNVIILGNGSRILGTTENAYLDIKYTNIKFVYVDFDIGWVMAPSNPITLSSNDIYNEITTEQIENITQVVNNNISETGPTIVNYINEHVEDLAPQISQYFIDNEVSPLPSNPTLSPGTYNFITVNDKGLVTNAENIELLEPTGVSPGTYNSITVNDKGLVTNATVENYDTNYNLEVRGSNFTASPNTYYLLDTTDNSITVTLPDNPVDGQWIDIIDKNSTFETNSTIISYDGSHNIHGNDGDLELDLNNTNIKLIFNNDNWNVINYTDTIGNSSTDVSDIDLSNYSLTTHDHDDTYVLLSDVGANNGVVPLNSSGKIDTIFLPPEALLANDSIDLGEFGVASFNSRTGSVTLTIDDLLPHAGNGSNKISRGDHNHDSQYVSIYSKGQADGVPELDSNGKIPISQIPEILNIKSYFDTLSISSIQYDSDDDISSITYTSGNKQTATKDSNSNITQVKYYDTDGTTLLATENFTYNSDGRLTASHWS